MQVEHEQKPHSYTPFERASQCVKAARSLTRGRHRLSVAFPQRPSNTTLLPAARDFADHTLDR